MRDNDFYIFASVADFCSYVPNVMQGIGEDKIIANCINATYKHILPVISTDIYNKAKDDHMEMVKRIVANYTAFELQQISNMLITESSASYAEGEVLKANFGEKQDALSYYASTADRYLDELLLRMQSDGYSIEMKSNSVFFSSLQEFEQVRYISNSYRTFIALQSAIKMVETLRILPQIEGKEKEIISKGGRDLYIIRALIATETILSVIDTMKIRYKEGINIATYLSNIEEKYNKEEQSAKKNQLKEEKIALEEEFENILQRIMAKQRVVFENKQENKGFIF